MAGRGFPYFVRRATANAVGSHGPGEQSLQLFDVGEIEVGRFGVVAVEFDPPVVDRGGVGESGRERRAHVGQIDTVEVVGDALQVLQRGRKQRAHAVVVLEVEVLVGAGGDLDHSMEELALGGAAAVVVPLVPRKCMV